MKYSQFYSCIDLYKVLRIITTNSNNLYDIPFCMHYRVKGIKGLRVADASVMRNVPSGNTNAPTIMIGEKVSDIIKEERHSSE